MIHFIYFRFHTLEIEQLITFHKEIISCENNNILGKQKIIVKTKHIKGIFQI